MADRQLNAGVAQTGRFAQPENGSLTYTVNYAGLHTSAISSTAWSTEDSGLTIGTPTDGAHTSAAVLSGSVGEYRVVVQATLADGTVDERYIELEIVDNSGARARNYA